MILFPLLPKVDSCVNHAHKQQNIFVRFSSELQTYKYIYCKMLMDDEWWIYNSGLGDIACHWLRVYSEKEGNITYPYP